MTKTGHTTPRCYAARYRDCDGRAATREHWISKALLQRVQYDGTGLRINGLSWFEGERDSNESELTSRILCARHNNVLQTLDNNIIALHDAWLASAEGRETRLVLQGESLERWALKVLVGMIVSGAARVDGRRVKARAPDAVLDVLFELRDLPQPRGFYFVTHDERDDGLKIKVNTAPRGHELEGVVLGITIQFLAFRFLTWLNPTALGDPHFIYRPAGFDFGARGHIELQWIHGASNAAVPIDIKLSVKPR